MIVTLTANPSVDRTLELDRLEVGEVNRAAATHLHAGGKGINVSRVLVGAGVPTLAVLPAGGSDGDLLVRLLGEQGVAAAAVPVRGETRSNITLVESSGATTKVNAPGPELGADEVDALLDAVRVRLVGARMVVAAGSLPAGTDEVFLDRLADLAADAGVPLALDTSGAPLAHAVRHGRLAIVKPNDEELGELVGRELVTVGDVLDAAREVIALGTRTVLVSLGAHGALLVDAERSWWAGGDPLVPASTVGAGDATLAGYLVAASVPGSTDSGTSGSGAPDPSAPDPGALLRAAVAWGRAAVLRPGTEAPLPGDVDLDAVRVVPDPDPSVHLKEL